MGMLSEFCMYAASDVSCLFITVGLSLVVVWVILSVPDAIKRVAKTFRKWDESYKHEDLSK
jgi:hypothetical protein